MSKYNAFRDPESRIFQFLLYAMRFPSEMVAI